MIHLSSVALVVLSSSRKVLTWSGWVASSERQVLPVLATDLARNATSYLVDGNW